MRKRLQPYQIMAAVIAVAGVGAALLNDAYPFEVLGLHLLWAATLWLLGHLRRGGLEPPHWVRSLSALVSPLMCALLVPLTGGLHSVVLFGLPAVPLLQASFLRGSVKAAATGALGTLLAGVTVTQLLGSDDVVPMAILLAATGMGAIQSARMYQRMDDAEHEAIRLREEELLRAAEQARQTHAQELRWANSERLAVVGRMAAAVSHEINNPLAYVSSNLAYLRRELPNRSPGDLAELDEVLAETQQGVEQIREIAQDLRATARRRDSAPTAFSLTETLESAVRVAQVRAGKRLKLELQLPESLPQAFGVPSKLHQVFVNLLANAIDATRGQPQERVRVTGRFDGERLVVLVEDSGIGLPEGWQTQIFKPFFTTKPEDQGTGLGLTLSRSYVEESGGALWAENVPAGGARFGVGLPVAPAPRVEAAPGAVGRPRPAPRPQELELPRASLRVVTS